MEQLPVTIPPGVIRNSTPAGVGVHWYDSHLIRWVSGRLRPILGWEMIRLVFKSGEIEIPAIAPTTIRAIHQWVGQDGFERQAVLCERHLFVVEGSVVKDITPLADGEYPGGIIGPASSPGGYGGGRYDQGTYDTPRPLRPGVTRIGEVWRLRNFGDHLLAMASPDGRLLRWIPGTERAERVKGQVSGATAEAWAPEHNRTFEVTPERYVMLFGMGGKVNAFGWCDQENVEDWNFANPLNTAGFYEVEPVSRIVDARVARYSTIFWTVQGTYIIEYKALPYIYTYSYLGSQAGPISGLATAAFAGNIIWPAADGFWMFDGSAVSQVACPILDWFQQTQNKLTTRMHMMGCFNGAASEVWWCFPDKDHTENNRLIVYNFEERWWSIGYLQRTCGYPGTMANPPLLANHYAVFRHEQGYSYEGEDLPWIRSGQLSPDGAGKVRSTTKQLIVDTDAPLNAVTYEVIATKGRFANTKEYTKGPKLPSDRVRDGHGKIDYRITGRDFALKMQSTIAGQPWSFGQGTILLSPRGRTDADDKPGA